MASCRNGGIYESIGAVYHNAKQYLCRSRHSKRRRRRRRRKKYRSNEARRYIFWPWESIESSEQVCGSRGRARIDEKLALEPFSMVSLSMPISCLWPAAKSISKIPYVAVRVVMRGRYRLSSLCNERRSSVCGGFWAVQPKIKAERVVRHHPKRRRYAGRALMASHSAWAGARLAYLLARKPMAYRHQAPPSARNALKSMRRANHQNKSPSRAGTASPA